jgi:hypothetical protein
MPLERGVHIRHHELGYPLLDVYRLEEARKARAEDSVHGVGVVQLHEGGVHAFGLKVVEEGGGDGAHALYVPAVLAAQREAVEDVEQGSLAVARFVNYYKVYSPGGGKTYPAPYRVLNMICPLIVLGTSRSI